MGENSREILRFLKTLQSKKKKRFWRGGIGTVKRGNHFTAPVISLSKTKGKKIFIGCLVGHMPSIMGKRKKKN